MGRDSVQSFFRHLVLPTLRGQHILQYTEITHDESYANIVKYTSIQDWPYVSFNFPSGFRAIKWSHGHYPHYKCVYVCVCVCGITKGEINKFRISQLWIDIVSMYFKIPEEQVISQIDWMAARDACLFMKWKLWFARRCDISLTSGMTESTISIFSSACSDKYLDKCASIIWNWKIPIDSMTPTINLQPINIWSHKQIDTFDTTV